MGQLTAKVPSWALVSVCVVLLALSSSQQQLGTAITWQPLWVVSHPSQQHRPSSRVRVGLVLCSAHIMLVFPVVTSASSLLLWRPHHNSTHSTTPQPGSVLAQRLLMAAACWFELGQSRHQAHNALSSSRHIQHTSGVCGFVGTADTMAHPGHPH